MKKINNESKRKNFSGILLFLVAGMLIVTSQVANAQENGSGHARKSVENFGNTLNIGLGVAYFGYYGQAVPFITANYEFQVARNFTLAPFIGFASYRSADDYYYGNGYYYYHETVIPVGAKGTYYFDELFGLNPKWDIYAALSLGFTYDHITWDDGYTGNTGVAHSASPLYLDGHIGAEYHFNRHLGLYLDLSTGVSTIGLAFHHR